MTNDGCPDYAVMQRSLRPAPEGATKKYDDVSINSPYLLRSPPTGIDSLGSNERKNPGAYDPGSPAQNHGATRLPRTGSAYRVSVAWKFRLALDSPAAFDIFSSDAPLNDIENIPDRLHR